MSNCRKWMNQRAAELNEDPEEYFDQMKENWLQHIELLAEQYFDEKVIDIDHRPDIDEFSHWLEEEGEEFTFKDYETWFASEVSAVCDDYADYKYEEMRDREL